MTAKKGKTQTRNVPKNVLGEFSDNCRGPIKEGYLVESREALKEVDREIEERRRMLERGELKDY